MTANFRYDKITLNVDNIDFDGVQIDGYKIAPGVTINNGGPNTDGPTITFTVYADEITMTDEAKAFAKEHGTHITEVWGDKH